MINADVDFNRFTFNLNLTSLILEGEAITPAELVIKDLEYRFAYNSGNLTAGYKILSNESLYLAAVTGIKFVDAHLDLKSLLFNKSEVIAQTHVSWVEPLIGVKTRIHPFKRVEVIGYADAGGFVVGEELSFQWLIYSNFYFTKRFFVTGGYRYWEIISDRSNEKVFGGVIRGWTVKLGIKI